MPEPSQNRVTPKYSELIKIIIVVVVVNSNSNTNGNGNSNSLGLPETANNKQNKTNQPTTITEKHETRKTKTKRNRL